MAKDKDQEQKEKKEQIANTNAPKNEKMSVEEAVKKVAELAKENDKSIDNERKKSEYKSFDDVKEIPGKPLGIRNRHIEEAAGLDPAGKNVLFQNLSHEVKKQIEEIAAKVESQMKQKEENDKRLFSLDEEIPDLKLKIQEKKDDLSKKGVSLDDKSNAFVKEVVNLEDQLAIKNEVKDALKNENQSLFSEMKEDVSNMEELSKQGRLIEKSIELNDKQRIKEAQEKAGKNISSAPLQSQQSAVLSALEALMIASEKFAKIREKKENAADDMQSKIDSENSVINSKIAASAADTDLPDEVVPNMDDHISGECMVYMAHTADGKDIVRIMDAKQATDFANSDECENIRKAVKSEERLPRELRDTAVISLRVENKEALLKEIEPIVKKAVNFADELHEYVSTDEKMKALKETLLDKCQIEKAVGADHYSQFTSKKIEMSDLYVDVDKEIKESVEESLSIGEDFKPGEKITVEEAVKKLEELVSKHDKSTEKALAESVDWNKVAEALSSKPKEADPEEKAAEQVKQDEKKPDEVKNGEKKNEVNVVEFSSITNGYVQSTRKVPADRVEVVGKEPKWNLWNFIKDKLHISKEYITPEDQKRLMAGEVTSMYFTEDGRQCRLRPIVDPLTKTISCEIEYKRSEPDYIGIQKALNLDDRDVENLKRVGVLDHAVPYQDRDVLVYKDKDTNNFLCVDKDSIKIDKKLHEMLDAKELQQLKQGVPVHCTNLIDKQGQRFNGWVLIDPSTRSAVVSRNKPAFVDKDFKIQVANNNNGQRAESVKDDKDAALKSKQTATDDAPNPQESNAKESKQQYKDYSQDDKSVTETTTTKSNKLK